MDDKVKGFYDEGYDEATRGNRVPDGIYHLVVTENLGEAPFSKPERPAVQLGTEIGSGEYEGRAGPRVVLQLGAHSFENKKGRMIETSEEQAVQDLMADVRAIHGSPAPAIPAGLGTLETLEATADCLIGDDFIGTVRTKASGFQDVSYYRNIDDPPKGFVLAKDLDSFKV